MENFEKNQADRQFYYTCKKILTEGFTDNSQIVRPKWQDGTPAHTKMIHAAINTYDIGKEFPLPTLRKFSLNNSVAEILWIWSKKSNNVNDLVRADGKQLHIWDQWANKGNKPNQEIGSIGKAYGYQLARKFKKPVIESTIVGACKVNGQMRQYVQIENKRFYVGFDKKINKKIIRVNQVDSILYDMKNVPANRRMVTNMFNHDELIEMNLEPCAHSMTFMVDTENNKLNAILNQRSQDMLAANGWNVAQYSALVYMFARACGLEPGVLTHVIANAHIYDRHIPFVEEMLKEYENGNIFDVPKVILNPDKKRFYDINDQDFQIVGEYKYNKKVEEVQKQMFPEGRIPVAE